MIDRINASRQSAWEATRNISDQVSVPDSGIRYRISLQASFNAPTGVGLLFERDETTYEYRLCILCVHNFLPTAKQ